jgi:hypothetical protein
MRKDKDPNDDLARVYDKAIPRTGRLMCRRCGHYWGIMVRCVDDGVEFPVLPIKNFLIEDSQGECVRYDGIDQRRKTIIMLVPCQDNKTQ